MQQQEHQQDHDSRDMQSDHTVAQAGPTSRKSQDNDTDNTSENAHRDVTRQFLNEFTGPHKVMIGPTLLASELRLSDVRESKLFEQDNVRVTIPAAFLNALTNLDEYDVRTKRVISAFAGQAREASPEEILEFADEVNIQPFSYDDAELDMSKVQALNWKRALGPSHDGEFEYVKRTLWDVFAFLVSSSKLLSRISYAVDRLRDAGVRVVDVGKAELVPRYESELQEIGWQDLGKFVTFSISNSAPMVDPILGTILTTTIDYTLYKIDP